MINKENQSSVETWVKAIKEHTYASWLIAEAIAISNLDPDMNRVVGQGVYPHRSGVWSFETQIAIEQTKSLIQIAYELLLGPGVSGSEESWEAFHEAFFILYNPSNFEVDFRQN